jgi:hypothetical protein
MRYFVLALAGILTLTLFAFTAPMPGTDEMGCTVSIDRIDDAFALLPGGGGRGTFLVTFSHNQEDPEDPCPGPLWLNIKTEISPDGTLWFQVGNTTWDGAADPPNPPSSPEGVGPFTCPNNWRIKCTATIKCLCSCNETHTDDKTIQF